MGIHRFWIRDIPVDDLSIDDVIARCRGAIRSGRHEWFGTVNSEFIAIARRDRAFRDALRSADFNVADSIGVVVALALRGRHSWTRVCGSDLVLPVTQCAADEGARVMFAGSTQAVLERARDAVMRHVPNAHIDLYSPPFGDVNRYERKLRAVIEERAPQVLLLALGAPKSEVWLARHAHTLGANVCAGVGGSFEMLAGLTPRCPAIFREFGFEWLYRAVLEPWRIRRWKNLLEFVPCVVPLSGYDFEE